MAQIKVIQSGLLSTLQDEGRSYYQHIGMPVSGAMDLYALRLANFLVDNQPFEACIEMTLLGSSIKFQSDTFIAITGASPIIKLNKKRVAAYQTLKIKAGDQLEIGAIQQGARSYLAIAGGYDVPQIMGSKSTYLYGRIGGYEGRPLEEGDHIPILETNKKRIKRKIRKQHIAQWSEVTELRIVPGPEKEQFTWKGLTHFLTNEFQLSPQCNRMGYRIQGPVIEKHNQTADILSSTVAFGTIQVPGDGLPIIMMADRQTTGGYPRIANVISADHHILAQLKPGDKIRFKEVSLETAHQLHFNQMKIISQFYTS